MTKVEIKRWKKWIKVALSPHPENPKLNVGAVSCKGINEKEAEACRMIATMFLNGHIDEATCDEIIATKGHRRRIIITCKPA